MPHSTKSKTKSYRGFSGWLDSLPAAEREAFVKTVIRPMNDALRRAGTKKENARPDIDAMLKDKYMLNNSDKVIPDPNQKYALVYDEHGNKKGIIGGKLAGLIGCKIKKVDEKSSAVYSKNGYLKGIITGPGSDLRKYSLDPLKVMPPVEKIEKIK